MTADDRALVQALRDSCPGLVVGKGGTCQRLQCRAASRLDALATRVTAAESEGFSAGFLAAPTKDGGWRFDVEGSIAADKVLSAYNAWLASRASVLTGKV